MRGKERPRKKRRRGRRQYILELSAETTHRNGETPLQLTVAANLPRGRGRPRHKKRRRGRRRYILASPQKTDGGDAAGTPGLATKKRRRGRRRYILELSVENTHRNGETPLLLSVAANLPRGRGESYNYSSPATYFFISGESGLIAVMTACLPLGMVTDALTSLPMRIFPRGELKLIIFFSGSKSRTPKMQ